MCMCIEYVLKNKPLSDYTTVIGYKGTEQFTPNPGSDSS